MKQQHKKSGLYEFLSDTGVLTHGTNEDIVMAKKQYWAAVRKEWKQKRRAACKSYTVFFTNAELKILAGAVKQMPGGITKYIKQSALSQATGKGYVNKQSIGCIREALAMHYSSVVQLEEEKAIATVPAGNLVKQIVAIEQMVFEFL
jgi:hypothetical protein